MRALDSDPSKMSSPQFLTLRAGVVDLHSGRVQFADGSHQSLSGYEIRLLRYFVANGGRTISRHEILERIWNLDASRVVTRTVEMHISKLRKKLRDHVRHSALLLTVRGQGYCLAEARPRTPIEQGDRLATTA